VAASQPWLEGIDDARSRAVLEDLCELLFRPALGSQSKEIELRVFDLL